MGRVGDGAMDGRAKNSARPRFDFSLRLVRAGFEPFRADGFGKGVAEYKRWICRDFDRRQLPRRGSKPARRNDRRNRILAAPSFSPYHPSPRRPFAVSPCRRAANRPLPGVGCLQLVIREAGS
jgi:hypothetical protein